MKKISLDSVLLPALIAPFIMTYRLSWGQTPYWLFGLIFFGLLGYLVLDLLGLGSTLYWRMKQLVLWFLIIGVLGSAFVSAMIVRHQTHPIYMIHDMPLQQEIAIRFLLDGKNPYTESYFGTFLEQWPYSPTETNPALYHFVLLPFYLLFALPFYSVSIVLFGFFDARMPLLFLFLALLLMVAKLVRDTQNRALFLILLAFSPAMLPYTLEGRSDIFMFTFLFGSLYLLHKGRYLWAGIPLALAFAVKQSAWPIMPFYLAFLYFRTKKVKNFLWLLLPFIATSALIIGPFFLWDPKAFLDSTVFYLSGSIPHSYPISGYGFGKLLQEFGFIKDLHRYYPFYIWQILVGLPLLTLLIKFLKKDPSVPRLIITYGIFLFVFWYFSRYFNNSHLSYLSMVFITAYFFPQEKNKD